MLSAEAGTVRRRAGLGVAAVMVLTACTTGGGTAPTGTAPTGSAPSTSDGPASQPPEGMTSIRVGLGTAPPDPTSHYLYYAIESGAYEAEGLDVEIEPFNGDQTSLRALQTNEVQILWTGCQAAMQAVEEGAKFKIISAFAPNIDYILVGSTDITRAAELEGKNVGVSQPGAVSWSVPKLLVEADGGNFDNVNVVSVGGSSARVQALIARTIDAAALNSSFAARTEQYDFLHAIQDAAAALPDYLYACEVTTDQYIAENPEIVQSFVDGTRAGVQWFYENVDEAAAITQGLLPDTDPAELQAGVEIFAEKEFWKESGRLRQEAFDFTLQAAKDSGDITEDFTYEDLVAPQFTPDE